MLFVFVIYIVQDCKLFFTPSFLWIPISDCLSKSKQNIGAKFYSIEI